MVVLIHDPDVRSGHPTSSDVLPTAYFLAGNDVLDSLVGITTGTTFIGHLTET